MSNYFFVLGREKCSVFNGLRASRPVVQVFFYLAIEKKFFIGVIKEKSWTVGREMVKNGNFWLKIERENSILLYAKGVKIMVNNILKIVGCIASMLITIIIGFPLMAIALLLSLVYRYVIHSRLLKTVTATIGLGALWIGRWMLITVNEAFDGVDPDLSELIEQYYEIEETLLDWMC